MFGTDLTEIWVTGERAANIWRTGGELHHVAACHFEDFAGFRRDRQMASATFKDQQFRQVTQASNPAREAHGFGAAWARPCRFVARHFDHPTPLITIVSRAGLPHR
jgi:hypothetical protein